MELNNVVRFTRFQNEMTVGLVIEPRGAEELKCRRNKKLKVALPPEVGISSRKGYGVCKKAKEESFLIN